MGIMQIIRAQHSQLGPLYPVHRLDRITSGALVLARTRGAAAELAQQFKQRKVVKYYIALSAKRPAKKMGSVIGDMQRGRRGSWMLVRSTADPAVTRFVSASLAGQGGRPLRALLLKPETGRTHQLRVAMKALGAPVLGDARYADAAAATAEDRTYLHCTALRFTVGGEPAQVVVRPTEGAEFATSAFQARFDGWFGGKQEDWGTWFPESKLLCSELLL